MEQVFKTLVTRGASRDYFVFVIPVALELNLKAAAKSVGEKSVEMIHVLPHFTLFVSFYYVMQNSAPWHHKVPTEEEYKQATQELAQRRAQAI